LEPFSNANFQNKLDGSANNKPVITFKTEIMFEKKKVQNILRSYFVLFYFKPKLGVKY